VIDLNYNYQGKRAVLKRYKFASIEAKMLKILELFINTPKVLYVDKEKLIIEYIENNTIFDEAKFGKELAILHNQTNEFFGFEFDTTIGPLYQPNKKNNSWIDFFINEKILYMANLAYKEGQIDNKLLNNIEKFCNKLDNLIPNNITPSLIHGDIWGENLISNNYKNYLIDPAIYYAHSEIELAFIMMFNTFGKRFFDSYNEIRKIDNEFFNYRYKIYQLYPYLVHVRIYGSSYISGIRNILKEFL